MLTKKQHELLMFINQRLAATGIAPSFDEMKDALTLRSKSGIHRLITGLEERGFIRRLPHLARALPGMPITSDIAAVDLPLYGRIAAGTPIEALRDQTSTVGVPGSLIGR